MSSPLVLLTGGTGFVGAHILHELISTNHRVIIPVRPSSLAKADFFVKKYSSQPGVVKFVAVEDQTDVATMLPLLKGVTAVIHAASIIPGAVAPAGGVVKDILDPVVAMATALFEASLQVDTVKRFVFTSSSVAVFRDLDLTKKEYTEEDWNPLTMTEVTEGEWDPVKVYMGTKVFAEQKLWALTKEYKPAFDVVVICLPMVLGISQHDITNISNLGGPAGAVILYGLLNKSEIQINSHPQFINSIEAGKSHVAAVTASLTRTPDLPHRYLVSGGVFSYHRVIPALLKRYPTLEGKLPKADPAKYDEFLPPFKTEKAERELGLRFEKGWEQSVVVDLFGPAVNSGLGWSAFGGGSILKKD